MIIRSRKLKKGWQYKSQKKNGQTMIYKTLHRKHKIMQQELETGNELRNSRMTGSSCSTSGTRLSSSCLMLVFFIRQMLMSLPLYGLKEHMTVIVRLWLIPEWLVLSLLTWWKFYTILQIWTMDQCTWLGIVWVPMFVVMLEKDFPVSRE